MTTYVTELVSAVADADRTLDDALLATALDFAARLEAHASGAAGAADPEPRLGHWQRVAIRALRPAVRAYESRPPSGRVLRPVTDSAERRGEQREQRVPSRAAFLASEVGKVLLGECTHEARRNARGIWQGGAVQSQLRAWWPGGLAGIEPFARAAAAEFAIQDFVEWELELLAREAEEDLAEYVER